MTPDDRAKIAEAADAKPTDVIPPDWPYAHIRALARTVLDQEERLARLEGAQQDVPTP